MILKFQLIFQLYAHLSFFELFVNTSFELVEISLHFRLFLTLLRENLIRRQAASSGKFFENTDQLNSNRSNFQVDDLTNEDGAGKKAPLHSDAAVVTTVTIVFKNEIKSPIHHIITKDRFLSRYTPKYML